MVILANCDVLLLRFLSLQVGVVPSFPIKQNSHLGKHVYPVSRTHMYQHPNGDTAACSPQALLHLVPVGPGLGGGPACRRLPKQTARTPQQRRKHTATCRPLGSIQCQGLASGGTGLPAWMSTSRSHAHSMLWALTGLWLPVTSERAAVEMLSAGAETLAPLGDILGGSGPPPSAPLPLLPLPAFSRGRQSNPASQTSAAVYMPSRWIWTHQCVQKEHLL